jgi:Helicase HerA, central domain
MKDNNFTFIGVVTNIIDDRNFQFIINNSVDICIQQIVGIRLDDTNFILSLIEKIDFKFYLTDTDGFFTNRASSDALEKLSLSSNKPKYCKVVLSRILGNYTLQNSKTFTKNHQFIDRFTVSPLTEVLKIENSLLDNVYGICHPNENSKLLINIGNRIELNNISKTSRDVLINQNIVSSHSFITGVTGSGKSRLAALLAAEILKLNIQVSVLDPHDEYTKLIMNSTDSEIYRYSRFRSSSKMYSNKPTIFHDYLQFYENNITPEILSALLPKLSDQQEEELHSVYTRIIQKRGDKRTFLADKPFDEYPILITHYLDILQPLINEYDKKPLNTNRPSLKDVQVALFRKIKILQEDKILITRSDINYINWLENRPGTLDILNIDYSKDEFIRRFLNAFALYFTRNPIEEFRVLIIDEAHLILRDENNLTFRLVNKLLREARKFNTSIVMISQNFSDIPEEIRSQFQNIFMFRELNNPVTKYFSDRICHAKLVNADLEFDFRVKQFP